MDGPQGNNGSNDWPITWFTNGWWRRWWKANQGGNGSGSASNACTGQQYPTSPSVGPPSIIFLSWRWWR